MTASSCLTDAYHLPEKQKHDQQDYQPTYADEDVLEGEHALGVVDDLLLDVALLGSLYVLSVHDRAPYLLAGRNLEKPHGDSDGRRCRILLHVLRGIDNLAEEKRSRKFQFLEFRVRLRVIALEVRRLVEYAVDERPLLGMGVMRDQRERAGL